MIQGQPIDRTQVAQLIAENEALRKRVQEWETAYAKQACDVAEYKVRAERAEAELAAARELLREAQPHLYVCADLNLADRVHAHLKEQA